MQPGLTDAEWSVFRCISENMRPSQIAAELRISPSYVTALLAQLRDKGVIRRRGHHPEDAELDRRYAYYEVTPGAEPAHKPSLPPAAKLDVAYTVTSQRNQHVAPIRLIRWQGWSVQGIPILRPDGRRPKDALPDYLIVYIVTPDGGEILFLAPVRQPWRESDTRRHVTEGVTPEEHRAITQVIAWSIGVEAVLDITTTRETPA
jgi:DNA-binding MarR family transcriptional regulator